jgi:hypothetical protein
MTQEYPHSLPISDTMLLFELSLACSSQDIENRTSVDIDDGFVFDIDPSLLVDNDKLVIDDLIGEGAFSSVYKGWFVPIACYHEFCLIFFFFFDI